MVAILVSMDTMLSETQLISASEVEDLVWNIFWTVSPDPLRSVRFNFQTPTFLQAYACHDVKVAWHTAHIKSITKELELKKKVKQQLQAPCLG